MIKVLHANAGKSWSGIEKRILTIAKLSNPQKIKNYFAVRPDSPLANEAKKINIECHPISFRNKCDMKSVSDLRKILKREKFDIIHAHRSTDHWITVEAAKIFKLPPKIIRTRHTHIPIHKGLLNTLLYKKFTDKIITVAEITKNELVKNLRISQFKVVSIHSSIFLDDFYPNAGIKDIRSELGIDNKMQVIGAVGKISYHKNYPLLLKAYSIVREKIQNTKLMIVGKGPLEEEMKSLAKRLKIEKDVYFLGERRDIPEIMATLDVFVLTSLVEGSPASLKEAMVFGKPVIATSVGGIPEIVDNGVNGILVYPDSADSLAEEMIRVLEDEHLREKLGKNARKTILERFTPSILASKTEEVYLEVAGS
jgi:glycosyltransferase involved in cell wall biosynthesis